MRLDVTRMGILAVAAALTGCVAVDPQSAVRRTAAGVVIGATLGAGTGAAVSINPVIGASFGAAGGAVVGGVAGLMMSEPAVTYRPIPARDIEFAPGFYDTWPPGYATRPPALGTPPPPPRPG